MNSTKPNNVKVDLGSLSAAQLNSIKKQLDDELEHLTNSFSQLRAAQAKFRECLRSIEEGVGSKVGGKHLVEDVEGKHVCRRNVEQMV